MERTRLPGYVAAGLGGALVVAILVGLAAGTGLIAAGPGSGGAAPTAATSAGGSAAASGAQSTGARASGDASVVATLPATDPQSIGRADAPVVVEVWADFQCPYCGLFTHGLEPSVLRTFVVPGTARLVFRDFAFLGAESTTAATAARCAGQQGAFWQFHDLLFASQNGENQGAFSDSLMTQMAAYLDLDATKFAACQADPSVASALEASRTAGQAAGIKGTPTIRIIGPKQTVRLDTMPTLPVLEATIDRLARGLPPPTPAPTATPAPSASGGATAPSAASAAPAASHVPTASASPAS
jgi:protein-disulfide isomerase